MLAKFKQKLEKIQDDEDPDEESSKKDDADKKEDDEEIVGDDWMKKSSGLRFEDNAPVLAKDASTKDDDWFDIYDRRNPLNQRRREKDKTDGAKKEKERRKMAL